VAALERRIVSVADVSSADVVLQHPERIAGEKFVSMFAMPLIAKGQVRGVIEVYFRRRVESDPEWTHFLEILARQAAVAVEDARLFNEMQRSFTELAVAYDAAIEGWSRIIRLRQRESEDMLRRLTDLTLNLARRMGIPEAQIANIYRGVLLHDIGKFSVPESILYKTSPLTDEEWIILHQHPVYAHELLQNIPYLRASVSIPYCHQENWDGSGYPRQLKGEEIPLEARIFAVVNAWLRMQFERPYAQAANPKSATDFLRKQAGVEFDPRVVEIFCEMLEEQKSDLDTDLLRVA
jgi:HD-GYP domain-containing protein (c-di-GMP phosphodiesterase class II)